MEDLNLLCANDNCTTLPSFAAAFFQALGISAYTERESSNYSTGHYFQGRLGDIDVIVADNDEYGYDDFPFWVNVDREAQGEPSLRELVDPAIRKNMLPAGFHVARIDDFGSLGERRVDYSLSSPD